MAARWRHALGAAAALVGAAVWLPAAQCVLLNVVDPLWTQTMVGTCGVHAPAYAPVAIGSLPDHVASAAVTSEDQRFPEHDGFDWEAIDAAWERYRDGDTNKRLRGGSTISQQVARNVFLWQGRNWIRKGLEAWYTVWLELLVPKQRILELYLNVAELGPCTFGVEAAAQRWYQRPAAKLTPMQSASLMAMLPAPRSRTPQSPVVQRRARWILANRVSAR